ncbi:MAG: Secretion system C-terminal sorting domain, partial [Bacteroidota bacterium]
GLEENVNLNWKLYPNPASDYTTIAIKEALMGSAIVLYDAFGREMLRSVVQAQETIIDFQHVPCGIYLLKVGSETRRLEVVR